MFMFIYSTNKIQMREIIVHFNLEQNREERDDYINVLYQNIKSGYESNFEKAKKGTTSGQGVGYDYGSVNSLNSISEFCFNHFDPL